MTSLTAAFTTVEMPPLSYDEVRTWISRDLEGGLGPETQQRLCQHLAGCASCAAFTQMLTATVEAVRQLPQEPAPADLRQWLLGLATS